MVDVVLQDREKFIVVQALKLLDQELSKNLTKTKNEQLQAILAYDIQGLAAITEMFEQCERLKLEMVE